MNNAKFADIIKTRCKLQDVSINKMLLDCGIRKSLIYDLEKRDWTPSIAIAEKIADYLECSVDYLLGRTDNAQSHKSANVVYGNLSNNSGIVGNVGSTISTTDTNPQAAALLEAFNKLDTFEQAKVLVFVDELNKNK